MTNHYLMTAEKIAELIANAKAYDADKIADLLQSLPIVQSEPVATPPFGSKRNAALALYKPPFKFEHGYIFDAEHHMVADDDDVESHVAARVRGWGRIGYMPDAAQLQDEVGRVIADALTAYWTPSPQPLTPITADDVELMAFNDCSDDWNDLKYREIWLEGYVTGANAVIKHRSEA